MSSAYLTIYDPTQQGSAYPLQSGKGRHILKEMLKGFLRVTEPQAGGVNPNISGLVVRSLPSSTEKQYYLQEFGPNSLNLSHYYDNSNRLKKKAHFETNKVFPQNFVIDLSFPKNKLDPSNKSQVSLVAFSIPEIQLAFEGPPGTEGTPLRPGDKIVINRHLLNVGPSPDTVMRKGKKLFE